MKFKALTSTLLITALISILILPGCIRTKFGNQSSTPTEEVVITFYGLFDSESIYEPIIQAYESENRNVNIVYKKFTDPEDYLDLIVNELAEGEGPDVFMMHNTWFPKHYKKLTPAPADIVNPEVFNSLFVDVATNEMVIPDEEGTAQVWGLPLYVDTLALYYNDDHIEDALPSQGRPSDTWSGIAADVTQLNKEDQSFSRFERAGIALGRGDNILRAFDIIMAMLLQYKVDLYNEDMTEVAFGSNQDAISALDLYASFGLPSKSNYSWNAYLADEDSGEKELETFANGKVSMVLGYSYAYEDIINMISDLKSKGEDTIDVNDIKIQEIPQVYDPDTSTETRGTYASYFAPVVSRTSENSDVAWDFLAYLVDSDNLSYYNETTHRPSALRSLITEQMEDPIYGTFAAQVGYAESVPMADPDKFEEAFLSAIDQLLDTTDTDIVLRTLAESIQETIPADGVKPVYVETE